MKLTITILLFSLSLAWGQDYLVLPRPANFVQDANTTFLVDLTSPKSQADYAAGSASLTLTPNNFVAGVGYVGTVGFSNAGNFNPSAWTIEAIIQVPYSMSSSNTIELLGWSNNAQFMTFDLWLDKSYGPKEKIYSYSKNGFLTQPFAGGNGVSIQTSATDKFFYVAFGADFVGQNSGAMAREITGDLLTQNMNFAPSHNGPTTNWTTMGTQFAASLPASLTFGNPNVTIKSLRISNSYRSELFTVAPLLPAADAATWIPATLDNTRAQSQSVSRNVGYPGSNNYQPMTVTESYLPLAPGSAAVSITLTNLPLGLYTFYVYGSIFPNGRSSLNQVWQPCPMTFSAVDSGGTPIAYGTMLLKQGLAPRVMQAFHFHVDTQTNVTATFQIPSNAMETPWLQKIFLSNQLSTLPDVAIKVSQNIAVGASNQLLSLTATRMTRDDAIWAALPPLNAPLQIEGTPTAWASPPTTVDTWITAAFNGIQFGYQLPAQTFASLDFLRPSDSTIFPASSILSGVPWPGNYADAGPGLLWKKNQWPSLTTDVYTDPRAKLLGARYILFAGSIMNSRGSLTGLDNPLVYFNGSTADIGHDGAMALVRLAYDWPALEMSFHDVRDCTCSPDPDYGVDWSDPTGRNGKMENQGLSGYETQWLLEAYDQVFPYIQNNQVFANAVHRHIPWVNSPQDVIRMLDRYLVWASVRDIGRHLIDQSSNIPDFAGQVLGPGPYTTNLFDLTHQYASEYPMATGTYEETYATGLSRSGCWYIGSFVVYAFGDALFQIDKANRILSVKNEGVPLPMDLSNLSKYPKIRSAINFIFDMWLAGGFPFTVGDAGGGPHSGRQMKSRLLASGTTNVFSEAWNLCNDPRSAWMLSHYLGDTRPAVAAVAATVTDPTLTAPSRVVPDYGAILELAPVETNYLKKTGATLRLGIGAGHAHSDYLDLNIFAWGLPMAVDLACRNEGDNWSRPAASWAFLHNHAIAHSSNDPNGAGVQTGEPWLEAFTPPIVRASYLDQSGSRLDRSVVFMQVGTGTNWYAVDVQRLSGGTYHTWCFHGCESLGLQLNVPLTAGTTSWTTRLNDNSQYYGVSTSILQAVWTMTRAATSYPYSFNGGGTLTTVACEPAVLGSNYNASLPPVNVRASLVGRANDSVFVGNPFSAPYSYAFPFLWTQSTNETTSIYPAVYEWYRGANAVVANIEYLNPDPVQLRITTAAGQVDTYEFGINYTLVVSRDAQGVRYAKLSGSHTVSLPDLSINPGPDYDAVITDMDYFGRSMTLSSPLPANPLVKAGNSGRTIALSLQGAGTSYTWADDLLVREGQITNLHVVSPTAITFSANQPLLFDGYGNRNSGAMVNITEDGLWHFRGTNVIKQPFGVPLTVDVFTDANHDGFVNVKTYEIGIGDHVNVPVDIAIQRTGNNWQVQSNVGFNGTIDHTPISMGAFGGSQTVAVPLTPPSALHVLH